MILYLCAMIFNNIRFILTDIEGTTSSVSFVYEVLFPYFRNNLPHLESLLHLPEVHEAFEQTIEEAQKLEGINLYETSKIIETLGRWSLEDKKITPLKTLQGILWKEAYEKGEIRGHIYPDVPGQLRNWREQGVRLGVFSSGSVAAQQLLFGYSESGDLKPLFEAWFDTKTGGKRECETYQQIAENLQLEAGQILFLSDITQELEAAEAAGLQTVQLVRPGTESNWKNTAADFTEIDVAATKV
jgi:enolase-phosphatase E1